ncbi:MAG TPA: shikimate kinase [Burkholderiales bacterium]|jgi:shikimate kinase|nr:shikimate kinase [Burkholderiales bacterium]
MRRRVEPAQRASASVPGNVFLVGMMGAGKTSVGKQLAKRLGKEFHDSDHLIEARTGVRIPVIFEIEGESGFRARERAVIEELTALQNIVLATGGGAVLDPRNRELLKSRGTVVYLRAAAKDLMNRTRHDKNRPLLQTADPKARLTELLEGRDPLYREVAHIVVDTGSQSLGVLLGRLEQLLAQHVRTHA